MDAPAQTLSYPQVTERTYRTFSRVSQGVPYQFCANHGFVASDSFALILVVLAVFWLQGLALAVVLLHGRAYLRATGRLLRWPWKRAGRLAARWLGQSHRAAGRLVGAAVAWLLRWLAERLRDW